MCDLEFQIGLEQHGKGEECSHYGFLEGSAGIMRVNENARSGI